jgi:cytochrome c553
LRPALFTLVVFTAIPPALADGIEETAQVCVACHGAAGVPGDPAIPIIEGLEKPVLQALAAYFSAKPWPNLGQPSAAEADARRALRANTSIGCTGCHFATFLAAGSVPRLAGQQHAYLDKTMLDFRTGARANNPGMTDLMNAADPADLAALASYLSGL